MTSPRHQVEAAIARLEERIVLNRKEMDRLADSDFAMVRASIADAMGQRNAALNLAITILRAECAEILRGDET